jgi:FSR family fosmidomycin resistance protein-like MFS transporter
MPAGVIVATAGVAAVGLTDSFALTIVAISISGLGVAAFHPEGARYAGLAAAAERGRGMSLFSVGGNAGFAVGPLLVTPLVLAFGLMGTVGLIVPGIVMSLVLVRELPRLRALGERRHAERAKADPRPDEWGPFTRLGGVVALRSGVYFGLQAFVPLWFVQHLHSSKGVGNGALTAMLVAGALGTLVGGRIVDRVGPRPVMIAATAGPLVPLVLFPFAGPVAAVALLVVVGFVLIASFSVSVVLGQQYLPNRLGLASGVTLGLAIGIGGLVATALGWLADAHGLESVLWVIAALPVPAVALAVSLPRERKRPAVMASRFRGRSDAYVISEGKS